MSDTTESPKQLKGITLKTVPELDESGPSDLETLPKTTIDSQELCESMLKEAQHAVSAFVKAEVPSNNAELMEACDSETECIEKSKQLKQEQAELKPRIKLMRDKKPKAKGSLNLSLNKASSTRAMPTMTPVPPAAVTGSTEVDAKEPTVGGFADRCCGK